MRNNGYHVMGCGELDLLKGDYWWGSDGKGSMEAWGFSDMIDNGGKGAVPAHEGTRFPTASDSRTASGK